MPFSVMREREERASLRWSGERVDEEFSLAFLIFEVCVILK